MTTSTNTSTRRAGFALVDALNHEWAERSCAGALPWPELEAHPGLDAVVERVRVGDDDVLQVLVRSAQAGDVLAARTVLQGMLGRLVRLAARDTAAGVDEYVSAFWCVLARHPLPRRPARIAANLALDTLKAVHGERRWAGRSPVTVWLAGDDLTAVLERLGAAGAEDGDTGPGPSAAGVIAAGRRLQLLDDPTGQLLHHVYVDGLSGVDAAARNGTTPGSLRVRCSRAVGRLAAHATELAEAA